MNKAPKQLQDSISEYYKNLNEFVRQQQIKESLSKLKKISKSSK